MEIQDFVTEVLAELLEYGEENSTPEENETLDDISNELEETIDKIVETFSL